MKITKKTMFYSKVLLHKILPFVMFINMTFDTHANCLSIFNLIPNGVLIECNILTHGKMNRGDWVVGYTVILKLPAL